MPIPGDLISDKLGDLADSAVGSAVDKSRDRDTRDSRHSRGQPSSKPHAAHDANDAGTARRDLTLAIIAAVRASLDAISKQLSSVHVRRQVKEASKSSTVTLS